MLPVLQGVDATTGVGCENVAVGVIVLVDVAVFVGVALLTNVLVAVAVTVLVVVLVGVEE